MVFVVVVKLYVGSHAVPFLVNEKNLSDGLKTTMTGSQCMKCRRKTANAGAHYEAVNVKGHARKILKSQCAVCGTRKSQFVSTGVSKKTGRGSIGKTVGSFLGGLAGKMLPF